ncbi:hypothetical protein C9J12_19270 [Photobacterium frigidiphilum]|uniref:Uncharacterized protein n=1 Tax=Photobacterium frigidiphilum TaxID=264736 RepID=A0A2T3JBH3_9GAMM|nr:hypothetical protein C9J12_19270 [Photobacterium frigidiphilum]
MNNVAKYTLVLYCLGALCGAVYLLGSNELFVSKVINNRTNPIVFSEGVAYGKNSVNRYREVHSILRLFWGIHSMKSTVLSSNSDDKAYNQSYSIHFLSSNLFSVSMSAGNQKKRSSSGSDLSEAHLNEYPRDEVFQIVKKTSALICYSSLSTSAVDCVQFVK